MTRAQEDELPTKPATSVLQRVTRNDPQRQATESNIRHVQMQCKIPAMHCCAKKGKRDPVSRTSDANRGGANAGTAGQRR